MQIVRPHQRALVPASHEAPGAPGVRKRVMLDSADFIEGRPQMLNWALLPAASRFQPHYHEDMQEVFVITAGRAEITVGAETAQLTAGDVVTVPPGAVHTMRSLGGAPVDYIVIGISTGRGGRTVVVAEEA